MPPGWKVTVSESDGRTWLNLSKPNEYHASISVPTNNANGETIQSQVIKAFAEDCGDRR